MDKQKPDNQHKDHLHGKTLESILTELVEKFGFHELSLDIKINCFIDNPTIKSSLTFLRRTPWARKKVESLYIRTMKRKQRLAAKKPAASE